MPQTYTFRYVNEYNGHESWAIDAESCDTTLVQLRTASGIPFRFQSAGALFALLQDTTSTM
jgi:hypothetical protein